MCRWVFSAASICWRFLRTRETPTRKLPIDSVGLVLLVVWVGALQVDAGSGQGRGLVLQRLIVGLAIVSVRGPRRLDHLGADRGAPDRRSVAVQVAQFLARHAGVVLGYAVFFGNVVLMPLWLADAARLHRDVGGTGGRAERRDGRPGRAFRRHATSGDSTRARLPPLPL